MKSFAYTIIERFAPEHIQLINSVPDKKADMVLKAIGVLNPHLNVSRGNDLVHESYPIVAKEIAAKLILNLPVGEGLTKAERHEWLEAGAKDDPKDFILRGTGLEVRDISVARWLLKVLSNPEQKEALYKTRREGKFSDHVIDLIEEDCVGGVIQAFARRQDRMAVECFGAEKLANAPEWLSTLGGRVTFLDNAPILAIEGREMSHCVGGYASNVKEGRSIICSIKAWGHRATVEYNSAKKIIQIKGRANTESHPICVLLAKKAVEKKVVKKVKVGRKKK